MKIENIVKTGIISAENLHTLLNQAALVPVKLVDASYAMPDTTETPYENYKRARIDNAVFFDIEQISDKTSSLPHMLPSTDDFERAMQTLGINNDDFVVLYGQKGTVMGPARVWWTFRVFGHDRIAILDGGLPAWLAAGFDMNTAPPRQSARSTYKAKGQKIEKVTSLETMQEISVNHKIPILDARSKERFSGSTPEPRPGLRSGHIPGSLNLPASLLIDATTGKLKSKAALRQILLESDLSPEMLESGRIITTCGSGITACMIALALFHLGNDNFSVYDGSWSEWGRKDMDTKVQTTRS